MFPSCAATELQTPKRLTDHSLDNLRKKHWPFSSDAIYEDAIYQIMELDPSLVLTFAVVNRALNSLANQFVHNATLAMPIQWLQDSKLGEKPSYRECIIFHKSLAKRFKNLCIADPNRILSPKESREFNHLINIIEPLFEMLGKDWGPHSFKDQKQALFEWGLESAFLYKPADHKLLILLTLEKYVANNPEITNEDKTAICNYLIAKFRASCNLKNLNSFINHLSSILDTKTI